MQNKEIEQVYNKVVNYTLFDEHNQQFKQSSQAYQVLWYDAKMKNYELLLAFIKKKRIAFAEIQSILVVDKTEHLEGVLKIWTEKPQPNAKVLISRQLSQ